MSNRVLVRPDPVPAKRSRRALRVCFALLVLLCCLVPFSGRLLVDGREAGNHVWALVLDGQLPDVFRSEAAAKALKSGAVDSVALSGTPFLRGDWSSALALWLIAREGADVSRVVELRHFSQSTNAEARALIPFFRERGADTVLLLTNAYHTARAARIFNSISGGDPVFVATDIGDPVFRPWGWWRERSMAKIWFEETAKSAWSALELLLGDREPGGTSVEVVPASESVLVVAGGTPTVPDSLFAKSARKEKPVSADSVLKEPETAPAALEPMEELRKEPDSAKSAPAENAEKPEKDSAAAPASGNAAADSAKPEKAPAAENPADSARR